jgi:tRNA(fMet)-specific endonuclease VapC
MILDTTFVIDLIAGDSAAKATLDRLHDEEAVVGVSALTVYEVRIGLRGESERDRYDTVTDLMRVHSLTGPVSRNAVEIQRTLRSAGKQIGDIDALIAATAVESGDPRLLTRNVGEFERVDELDVETY